MNKTAIQWTDLSWNPASGCNKISMECTFCYAYTLAENKRGTRAFPNGFDLTFRSHKLSEPRKVKVPSLIFTNSMSDLFHEDIPDSYRDDIISAMLQAPQHRYQCLTKRPKNALRYFATRSIPECIWLGCTVGVQKTQWRIDCLRELRHKARVLFLSCEPLLECLDADFSGIDWVIGGGESGSHLSNPKVCLKRGMVEKNTDRESYPHPWRPRDDRYHWARELRDATKAAGGAFYWKQWGGPTPKSGGRILDGREWNEMPDHIPGAMPAPVAKVTPNRQLPLLATA